MVSLLTAIRDDLRRFGERLRPIQHPQAGLYTFRLSSGDDRRRIHLRIEADGRGVLFVDVTDVVHLNPTAAEIAKWALDGLPQQTAGARLQRRFGSSNGSRWRSDLTAIYEMIARFSELGTGCPTCALGDVDRADPFGTPVHAPFKADLAITYDCTNDCPHCYNETERLGIKTMPVEKWESIIDRLCEVGVPHLIFTGGEATLHPDLPQIIRYADSRGPICGLNTNGRRLSFPGYVDTLLSAGLNHVQVTLGSHIPSVHDRMMNARAFHQTVRGIENAIEQGLLTITNTTLMRMNAGHIEETVRYLFDLGIRTFAVNGMIYTGGAVGSEQAIPETEMAPILIGVRDLARELGMKFLWYTPTQYCRLSPVELDIGTKRCNAGEYSLCVEPNGDVLPCQSYYTSAGNLLSDPWEDIWESDLFHRFRNRCDTPTHHGLPEKCWECPDLALCGGGCPIERMAADTTRNGDRNASDYDGQLCTGCGHGTDFAPVESISLLPRSHDESGKSPTPNPSPEDGGGEFWKRTKLRSTGVYSASP